MFEYGLVPTRVGMILNEAMALVNALACPHTRGDDPKSNYILTHELNLSPHAWG